jgi:hypothetical protein
MDDLLEELLNNADSVKMYKTDDGRYFIELTEDGVSIDHNAHSIEQCAVDILNTIMFRN